MRRLVLYAALAIGLASPATCVARANAQVSVPPAGASKAELDAAKAMSMQANAKADAAATAAAQAQAAIPPVCATPPQQDTLTGSAGVGAMCTPRLDNSRATVIQAKTTTTLTDATWSVTFDAPFASTPIYADARVYGTTNPYLCTVTSLTTTSAGGKCYQLVATTLPTLTTSLAGLVISPFASAASGLSVRVVARQ